MIAALKRGLPWWIKIAAKLLLSRLPVGGAVWQRLGLFEPGAMDEPAYALSVFRRHYEAAGAPGPGFAFLELGPGDSLASAVIGRAHGARRSWLVDAGAHASGDMGFYRRLAEALDASGLALPQSVHQAPDPAALLRSCKSSHHQHGLASLRELPDSCCDFLFSQAVLEHLPRDEFAETCKEIARVLRPGARTSHQIDYRDHLSGGLVNLRFSERLWEAPWFAARSGFYTNRLRHADILDAFARAGLETVEDNPVSWPVLPIARDRLAPPWRTWSEEDLRIRESFLVLRKPT